jgi:DNA repair protein RecO (recombination protein O)
MPRILRTQALSLHSIPFAESSKIVTFFTRDFGKLNFLAKGARRPKSKFGGALETFTHASLILYKPEMPKLFILSDAEIINSFSELHTSTEKYQAAAQIVDFVLKTVDFNEPNARLFNLVLSAFTVLANKTWPKRSTDNLVLAFFLKAASFLGYRPELENCVSCRAPVAKLLRSNEKKPLPKKLFFDIANGGILCSRCKNKNLLVIPILPSQLAYLKALLYFPLKRSLSLPSLTEIKDLILQYLAYHFGRFDITLFAPTPEKVN